MSESRTALVVVASLCASAALAGCGHSNSAPTDAGANSDAGASDAGSAVDAGPVDGGTVIQTDAGVATRLPPLPGMSHVVATMSGDSASIVFDPVDGALDYRVYPLPPDSDIQVDAHGHVVVQNAIYRCAGNRETPVPDIDNGPSIASDAIRTEVDQQTVGGFLRTLASATLGYVYIDPAPGLIPVYALGEGDLNADTTCYFARWGASRSKKYTTSTTERSALLAAFARDDGIVFYVPAAADATTTQIYYSEDQPGTPYQARYYFSAGPEAASHSSKTAAFQARTAAAAGTVPLMRVFYANQCGQSHDELVAGRERFNRAYMQGDALPWWTLLWSGLSGPTTLVVEALDGRCPFQGHLSPQSFPAVTNYFGSQPIIHQPFYTLDQMKAASTTSELFINGQDGPAWIWDGDVSDAGNASDAGSPPLPNAIARAFINVNPLPNPQMDFFADFAPDAGAETFTEVPCGIAGGNCFATYRYQSPTFDEMFLFVDQGPTAGTGLYAAGPILGQWWVTYADDGSDTNGKYRLTANQKANIDATSFLHVTMETDMYSTVRRYPQILISDQFAPVQYNLPQGHTLVIQPRSGTSTTTDWPVNFEFQICNMRTWDVNNQCPVYDLYHLQDATGTPTYITPGDELGEYASVDKSVRFDVYTSSQLTYLFLDGKPYACAQLPAGDVPTGPVSVTWGDVLYHSSVDHTYAFHTAHLQIETERHFDNLGFSSGVLAPDWDSTRFPCVPPIAP